MTKYIIYREHGTPARVEADEPVLEDTLGIYFKRGGEVVARFRWALIHGWKKDFTKPKAKKA